MAFFNKIKQGVSEAGNKAKIMVEVNRLKIQINQKEKEIYDLYAKIGERVFQSIKNKNLGDYKEEVKVYFEEIIFNQEQVREFQAKIQEINNIKECVCGKTVELDTRFCPHCGYKFAEYEY